MLITVVKLPKISISFSLVPAAKVSFSVLSRLLTDSRVFK